LRPGSAQTDRANLRKVLIYAFLAYLWPFTDDDPVNLDSVFSYTPVNHAAGHLFLEVMFHVLTLVFLALSLREIAKTGHLAPKTRGFVLLFVLVAFGLASLDDLVVFVPFARFLREPALWYPMAVASKLVSVGFFYLAVRQTLAFADITRANLPHGPTSVSSRQGEDHGTRT